MKKMLMKLISKQELIIIIIIIIIIVVIIVSLNSNYYALSSFSLTLHLLLYTVNTR